MYKLVIFNGSARKGQYTEHVTQFVKQIIDTQGQFDTTIVDPRKLDLKLDNEGQSASPKELTQLVEEADAYLLISPEYNHGCPGSLKYMLDLNLKQYIHKPVAFVGLSSGPWGGTRVIECLVPITRELGMVATFTDVNITHVKDEVDDTGAFKDPEKWKPRVEKMLAELTWMTKTLKYGRENITV